MSSLENRHQNKQKEIKIQKIGQRCHEVNKLQVESLNWGNFLIKSSREIKVREKQQHTLSAFSQRKTDKNLRILTKCFLNGQILTIIRQIFRENQVILVEDVYEFHKKKYQVPKLSKINRISSNKRRLSIIKKQCLKNREKKRNFRNTVKNFMKGFKVWAKAYLEKEALPTKTKARLLAALKPPFNNKLLYKIASCSQLNFLFLNFLDEFGKQYIENSHIHDKQSHMIAFKEYRKLMKMHQRSSQLFQKEIQQQGEKMQKLQKQNSIVNQRLNKKLLEKSTEFNDDNQIKNYEDQQQGLIKKETQQENQFIFQKQINSFQKMQQYVGECKIQYQQ